MDAIKRGVTRLLQIALMLAVLFVVAVLAEFVTPLHAMDAHLAALPGLKSALVGLTTGLAAVGVFLLVGTQFIVRVGDERDLSQAEVERTVAARRAPTAWSRFTYRLRGRAAGAGFSDEASFREVKEAWRRRAWRDEPRWRRFALMALGGLLTTLGLFGLPFVLGPPFIKLLVGGAVLYAAARTAIGFAQA
jgi:hypothetical protein